MRGVRYCTNANWLICLQSTKTTPAAALAARKTLVRRKRLIIITDGELETYNSLADPPPVRLLYSESIWQTSGKDGGDSFLAQLGDR